MTLWWFVSSDIACHDWMRCFSLAWQWWFWTKWNLGFLISRVRSTFQFTDFFVIASNAMPIDTKRGLIEILVKQSSAQVNRLLLVARSNMTAARSYTKYVLQSCKKPFSKCNFRNTSWSIMLSIRRCVELNCNRCHVESAEPSHKHEWSRWAHTKTAAINARTVWLTWKGNSDWM